MKPVQKLMILSALLLVAPLAQASSVCMVQSPATATCREFETMVTINGREQPGATGVACLQSDNFWTIVSGPGFGSSFYRNDNLAVAYPGGPYGVADATAPQPTRIRYIVTRKNVCVPSMPHFYPGGPGWVYPHRKDHHPLPQGSRLPDNRGR